MKTPIPNKQWAVSTERGVKFDRAELEQYARQTTDTYLLVKHESGPSFKVSVESIRELFSEQDLGDC